MRAFPALVVLAIALIAGTACELSARVGELRQVDDAGASTTLPPQVTVDGGLDKLSWRLLSPTVPCTIYAMAEVRADDLYLGCNGGRIYRFDGVSAKLAFEIEDTRFFSLLWIAPDGQVWAGAQSSYDAKATTQLYRFDGTAWTKFGADDQRLTALAGVDATNVWAATAKEIRRFDGTAFTKSYAVSAGELRACAFSAANKGYCAGTSGLAVVWNGQTWSPMTAAPWSAQAEVFGVEVNPFDGLPTFFYGEPITDPHGDSSVRAAKWTGSAFTSYSASTPTFTSYHLSRTRTGRVNIGGREYTLLSVNEQYGQALLFDAYEDAFRTLCGPVLAFSAGTAKTRVGGFDGLLATIVGSGGNQAALATTSDAFEFSDLSVADDGAAWARIEDPTVCGSTTDRVVRFEDSGWREVPAPQPVMSGRGLAATASDRAYTLTIADELLVEYKSGAWAERASMGTPWSLWAKKPDDVWVGGYADDFGHFDGKALTVVSPPGRGRQIRQIVADNGSNVWMVALGYTQDDTNVHLYRYADGKRTQWDLGIERYEVRVAALDATHAWHSGAPAKAWDGVTWHRLPLDASHVWARSPEEVYFTFAGDIFRWDGARRERVYHGFIPITAIDGSKDRAFAVGPGGLTVELAAWPSNGK